MADVLAGTLSVRIQTLMGSFKRDMALVDSTMNKTTRGFKSSMGAINKLSFRTLLYGSFGIYALQRAFRGIMKPAIDFQAQLAQVSTMLDETSMKIMPQYNKQLKALSIQFGQTSKTLTDGLYDILSATIDADEAMNVLEIGAKAAVAGITDTGVATDAIVTILKSYQLETKDASKVSDVLFGIVKKGRLTFNDLAGSIGMVASQAASSGVSLEELGAVLATITRAGLNVPMTMTGITNIIKAFLTPTVESAEFALSEFNLELNTTTLREIGLIGVMNRLSNATQEQLATIFPNIRGLRGLVAAFTDLEGVAEDFEFLLDATGLTQEAYAKQTETVRFQLNQLKQIFKVILVMVGDEFIPKISEIAKATLVWFEANKDLIQVKITDWVKAFIEKVEVLVKIFRDHGDLIGKIFVVGTLALVATKLWGIAAALVAIAASPAFWVLGAVGWAALGVKTVMRAEQPVTKSFWERGPGRFQFGGGKPQEGGYGQGGSTGIDAPMSVPTATIGRPSGPTTLPGRGGGGFSKEESSYLAELQFKSQMLGSLIQSKQLELQLKKAKRDFSTFADEVAIKEDSILSKIGKRFTTAFEEIGDSITWEFDRAGYWFWNDVIRGQWKDAFMNLRHNAAEAGRDIASQLLSRMTTNLIKDFGDRLAQSVYDAFTGNVAEDGYAWIKSQLKSLYNIVKNFVGNAFKDTQIKKDFDTLAKYIKTELYNKTIGALIEAFLAWEGLKAAVDWIDFLYKEMKKQIIKAIVEAWAITTAVMSVIVDFVDWVYEELKKWIIKAILEAWTITQAITNAIGTFGSFISGAIKGAITGGINDATSKGSADTFANYLGSVTRIALVAAVAYAVGNALPNALNMSKEEGQAATEEYISGISEGAEYNILGQKQEEVLGGLTAYASQIGEILQLSSEQMGTLLYGIVPAFQKQDKPDIGSLLTTVAGVFGMNSSQFAQLAAVAPTFAYGGIVQGALGQAKLAMVHGGEEIITRSNARHSANSGANIVINITGNTIADERSTERLADTILRTLTNKINARQKYSMV